MTLDPDRRPAGAPLAGPPETAPLRGHAGTASELGALPSALRMAADLVRASPFPSLLMAGPDHVVLAHSEAYAPFLEGRPDPLGRPMLEIWPETAEALAPQLGRVLAGETLRFEAVRFELMQAGVPREAWFDYGFSPVRDEDGRVLGILNVAMEQTARVRTEAMLRAREAEARADAERVQLALAAGAIVGRWFWDLPTDRFTVDEAFARAFGLDPALGRSGLSLAQVVETVHPEDQAGLAAAIDAAIRQGGPYAHQYRVRRHDGRYHWIEANGEVRHGPNGTPLSFPGVLIDVEERRRVEAERRAEAARLAAVLDALPVGVLIADADGRLLRHNAAHEALWGAVGPASEAWEDYGEWVGYWTETGERLEAQDWAMARALLAGETVRGDMVEIVPFDGSARRTILLNGAPILGADGAVAGAVITQQDVTGLRAAERALTEALAEKEALLYEVNHRVKNNLQVVVSLLSVQAGQAADPEVRRGLMDARARIDVIASIHQSLYATGAHGDIEMIGFLHGLARKTVDSLSDERVGLRLEGSGEVRLPLARAVPLALIASELLTNAVKYAFPDGREGTIALAIAAEGEALRLTVSDDGVGLSEGFDLARPAGMGTRVIGALARQLRAEIEGLPAEQGCAFAVVLPAR